LKVLEKALIKPLHTIQKSNQNLTYDDARKMKKIFQGYQIKHQRIDVTKELESLQILKDDMLDV